jgi:Zn-dependent protease with chaperone function
MIEIPKASAKAMEYYRADNQFWIWDQVLPIALFILLLFSGLSAKIRNIAKKLGRVWFFEVIIYCILFGLIFFVVQLPLAYYSDYVMMHQFDLSSQNLNKWLLDSLKSSSISLIVGVICVLVVYFLIRKSPKRWWLYCSFLMLPFILLTFLITPLWIEPLFNKFGPMKDKVLETKILALADRSGISGTRVFEVEKGQDTNMVNAYVTGFGNTKRIVLWDTIIQKLDTDQLLFVMGHEMGHYVLNHVEKDIVFQFVLSFLFFLFLSLGPFVIRKYEKSLRFHALADIASLPLLLLMAQIFILATTPLSNAVSRHFEREADRFGLEITQNNQAAAEAFVELQKQNLANPTPGSLFIFWRATHPPLAERITFCNTYKPWAEGKPLEYQSHIKKGL